MTGSGRERERGRGERPSPWPKELNEASLVLAGLAKVFMISTGERMTHVWEHLRSVRQLPELHMYGWMESAIQYTVVACIR